MRSTQPQYEQPSRALRTLASRCHSPGGANVSRYSVAGGYQSRWEGCRCQTEAVAAARLAAAEFGSHACCWGVWPFWRNRTRCANRDRLADQGDYFRRGYGQHTQSSARFASTSLHRRGCRGCSFGLHLRLGRRHHVPGCSNAPAHHGDRHGERRVFADHR